jgi:acyl-lipid omega-6 desaturase (Delta-12 desaturase)
LLLYQHFAHIMIPETLATPTADASSLPQISSAESSNPLKNGEWKKLVAKFTIPSRSRAIFQMVNTMVPFLACWIAMYFTVQTSFWITALLALLAGSLSVRIFIIFHDCGHGSFFKSRTANDIVGFICGMLTFTPYLHWRWEHALHHATSGDLDRRGVGDIWTLTVEEYLASPRLTRLAYRLMRHPVVLFGLGPLYLFFIQMRIPSKKASRRDRNSVWYMNLAIGAWMVVMGTIFGWKHYLILQLCVTLVAGGAGVWMFYVQHQFEDVYWERREDWDFATAALHGSSFYKLPKILQWFTGNIGFHHIHHLSSRIPNYHLERCHKSHPLFSSVEPLTFWKSLKSLTFRLFDESQRKLVSFRHIRHLPRNPKGMDSSGGTPASA